MRKSTPPWHARAFGLQDTWQENKFLNTVAMEIALAKAFKAEALEKTSSRQLGFAKTPFSSLGKADKVLKEAGTGDAVPTAANTSGIEDCVQALLDESCKKVVIENEVRDAILELGGLVLDDDELNDGIQNGFDEEDAEEESEEENVPQNCEEATFLQEVADFQAELDEDWVETDSLSSESSDDAFSVVAPDVLELEAENAELRTKIEVLVATNAKHVCKIGELEK